MKDKAHMALRIARDALDTDADMRDSFVSRRCGDDTDLRANVIRLLDRIAAEEAHAPAIPNEDAIDALLGTSLGPFRVVERVGRGGMGVVYRGVREGADFEQTVALKLIRRGFDFDDVQARFLRERRILARLKHPGLARFIDGGVAPDGRPWFALEFVSGVMITRWSDAQRLDLRARAKLFLDICAAVQYAHTQLIVHRDLKPGNVLIDETGAVRLLDFGIAGLLDAEDVSGDTPTIGSRHALTPEYAAPEQFGGGSAVVATDVYSLGVILYQLIAGALPYAIDRNDLVAAERTVRETPPESLASTIQRGPFEHDPSSLLREQATIATAVWSAHGDNAAPTNLIDAKQATLATTVWPDVDVPRRDQKYARIERPPLATDAARDGLAQRLFARRTTLKTFRNEVRGDLSRIVEKALAKEPQRRYSTVEAFGEDLARWLGGAPVRAAGNRLGYRFGKFVKRNRVAVGVALILSLGLIGTTATALFSAHQERIQRDAALAETARANAVREYVMLMFGDAAERRDSATLTARDVLNQGAQEIFSRYQDRPQAGQEIALNLSELFMQLGDTEGAAPLLERLLRWSDIDANPAVQASARYNLAQVEYMRGKREHARELVDSAQAFWVTQPARFQSVLNESRTIQAQIERAEGKPEQAVATLEKAISERRAFVGSSDREVGSALNSLALALTQLGRYEEAIERANEGYKVFETLGQARSATGLALINNRAITETYLGRFAAAEADYRQVVDLRRELYGESPELAASQNNLALELARQKRYAEAITLLEDALQMALAHGGKAGRETIMSRVNLAEAYVVTGRGNNAMPLAEEAVKTATDQYGAASLLAGVAHRARANANLALGHKDAARKDLEAAIAVFSGMGKGGEIYLKALSPLRENLAPTALP